MFVIIPKDEVAKSHLKETRKIHFSLEEDAISYVKLLNTLEVFGKYDYVERKSK